MAGAVHSVSNVNGDKRILYPFPKMATVFGFASFCASLALYKLSAIAFSTSPPCIQLGRLAIPLCPPSFLPHDPKSKGILFFDELNAAPPLVQASLYQLTLDRRIGEYILPEGWRILGAGNRAEDASVVFRMPAALSNRFVHVDFEVNVDDWSEWATINKTHPLVIGFIRLRREMLFDMSNHNRAFPTPRSWEMVSDALKTFGNFKDIEDVIIGIVGEGASIEFLSFCQTALSEEMVLKIIDNPETAAIPKDLGAMYALVSYIASRAEEKKVMEAAGHLVTRLNPELGVFLIRDVLAANPKFMTNAGYKQFVKKHASLLI